MNVDLVVVGLGYVGLPVAREAVRVGHRVVGFDRSAALVESLNAGRSHVGDVPDGSLEEMRAAGFQATTDPSCVRDAQVALICVPTPLEHDGRPDLGPIEGAVESISEHLREGTLVVLESTTYPGTTEEVVRPIIERESGLAVGEALHLAYSPERIDPGNDVWGLRNTPKIVAGTDRESLERAAAFYETFVEDVVRAGGTREAEMAKLLENTYRHVNIALVNEMAIFCDELGVDLWEAIRLAATKPFGYAPFYPGPGVGGHCIPVDPAYLSYRVRLLGYPFRFVELAREINDRMPSYVAMRAMRMLNDVGKPLRGSRVLLLGVTYKADVADERESPARNLGLRLLELGADLRFHDPYVEVWSIGERTLEREVDVARSVEAADLTIIVQTHSGYDLERIAQRAPLVLDTRGGASGPAVQRL